MRSYISERQGATFARKLPQLRRRLGVTSWADRDDKFGIDGNTFRAFRTKRYTPSSIYRSWAELMTEAIDPDETAKRIGSRAGFLAWHEQLQTSLERHWRSYEETVPPIAHRLKMVDLFVKWLSKYELGKRKLNKALERNANCALDRQTLKKLAQCYSNALPLKNPSMGDIQNRKAYDLCQELIGMFARRFGGTRLLFDYYAWKRGG